MASKDTGRAALASRVALDGAALTNFVFFGINQETLKARGHGLSNSVVCVDAETYNLQIRFISDSSVFRPHCLHSLVECRITRDTPAGFDFRVLCYGLQFLDFLQRLIV